MNVEKLGGKTMTAKISVIMGSTSDWETMKEACQILDEFGVSYEKKVVSAHRTPDLMFEYAQNARKKESKSLLQEQGSRASAGYGRIKNNFAGYRCTGPITNIKWFGFASFDCPNAWRSTCSYYSNRKSGSN